MSVNPYYLNILSQNEEGQIENDFFYQSELLEKLNSGTNNNLPLKQVEEEVLKAEPLQFMLTQTYIFCVFHGINFYRGLFTA